MFVLAAILLAQSADPAEIEAQLRKLRSDSIEERASAAEGLRRLGPSAIPALEKAATDPDSEVSGRIRQILAGIVEDQARAAYLETETLLQKARSLRIEVKFTLEVHLGDEHDATRFDGSGTLLLKGDSMLSDLSLKTQEPPQRFLFHTDGSTLTTRGNDEPWQTRELPAVWKDGIRVAIARLGAFSCWQSAGTDDDADPRKTIKLSNFHRLPADKTGDRLQYMLRSDKPGDSGMDVTLWVHPKTRVPLRREYVQRKDPKAAKKPIKMTEVYQTFEINPDIPDEALRRPEK